MVIFNFLEAEKMCCGRKGYYFYLFSEAVNSILFVFTYRCSNVLEGMKCLFNDAFNSFYLRLYGVVHMVKDHSAMEENPMGYYFRLAARNLLYAISRSSQCSTTGVSKVVVCIILSIGWCI